MTTIYSEYRLDLSEGQLQSIYKAYSTNNALVLSIKYNNLIRGDKELMLTNGQINKIKKAIHAGKGVQLKISKTQIRKLIKKGGSLWSTLLKFGSKLLPKIGKIFGKVAPAVGVGAAQAAASFGVEKALGGGCLGDTPYNSPYEIPYEGLSNIIPYQHLLNKNQLSDLRNSMQSGSGMRIQPTKAQRGGFLGTLLASIGIPMLLKAFTGGEHGNSGRGMQVQPPMYNPYTPTYTPYMMTAGEGMQVGRPLPQRRTRGGQSKKKGTTGKGLLLGKNSPFNGIPILGSIF